MAVVGSSQGTGAIKWEIGEMKGRRVEGDTEGEGGRRDENTENI